MWVRFPPGTQLCATPSVPFSNGTAFNPNRAQEIDKSKTIGHNCLPVQLPGRCLDHVRLNDRLYNRIKGGLYHSTSITGYKGIRATAEIRPNLNTLPFSHGQSPHSHCYKLGAISLLDLRNPKRPLVGKDGYTNWATFLSNHKPLTVLLEIKPELLTLPLDDYDSLNARSSDQIMVPEAEACYPGPISIQAISRVLLICGMLRSNFWIIPGYDVSEDQIRRAEESCRSKWNKFIEDNPGYRQLDILSRDQFVIAVNQHK
jgi:hypothetical protein